MHFEQFEFVGLSLFMQRLTEYGPELSYVTVCAHPSRVQMYRMELESGPLGDWLVSQVAEPPHIEDWSSLLAGLDIWFRSVMSSGLSSAQRREFHVQAVLPKGGGRPVGGKVVVRGLGFDEEQYPVDPPSQASQQVYGLAKLQVANNAVAQVAGTLQSFLAMKAGAGLPPALQGMLHAIVQNPALLAAVQEPDVQGLLQDQQILTALAAQLRDFASMKKLAAPQPVPS